MKLTRLMILLTILLCLILYLMLTEAKAETISPNDKESLNLVLTTEDMELKRGEIVPYDGVLSKDETYLDKERFRMLYENCNKEIKECLGIDQPIYKEPMFIIGMISSGIISGIVIGMKIKK